MYIYVSPITRPIARINFEGGLDYPTSRPPLMEGLNVLFYCVATYLCLPITFMPVYTLEIPVYTFQPPLIRDVSIETEWRAADHFNWRACLSVSVNVTPQRIIINFPWHHPPSDTQHFLITPRCHVLLTNSSFALQCLDYKHFNMDGVRQHDPDAHFFLAGVPLFA